MRWIDTTDIAISLEEKYPDTEIFTLSFPKLRDMVLALDGFAGKKDECNEKILEAIQMGWADERA